MTAEKSISLLARDLYERYDAALKWLEPSWQLLPEATREVWGQMVTPKLLEQFGSEARMAYIQHHTSPPRLESAPWEGSGEVERRHWRNVVERFIRWGDD